MYGTFCHAQICPHYQNELALLVVAREAGRDAVVVFALLVA